MYYLISILIIINFVIENEPEIVYHPKSCYTSRKLNYSDKLNEILAQDELSNKVVILDNYNEEIMTSENLGT